MFVMGIILALMETIMFLSCLYWCYVPSIACQNQPNGMCPKIYSFYWLKCDVFIVETIRIS